jgi:hypothetical protein
MILPSHPSFVPLFHSLECGTVEQDQNLRNNPRNRNGTYSLKTLANKVLERNKGWNKPGTVASNSVPPPDQPVSLRGTENKERILLEEKETSADNTNKFKMDPKISVLSVPSGDPIDKESLLYDYEERLAITEYDGQQTPLQAECIAYQDAFISVLTTLPQETYENCPGGDWLDTRIKAAKG